MARKSGDYSLRIGAALNGLTYSAGLISFLSVARYVGIIFSISFIFLFALALYFDYRKRYAINRGMLNIVLVIFIAINSLRITLDNFATPVVEALLILIAIKFIEEKKTRDYMQIYAVSTFLLAGSALLTIDIQFLIYLVVLMFMLPVCIVLLTFYSQESGMTLTGSELSKILSKAVLIPLVSIPMTALMFLILPRTGYPLLNFLGRGGASTGFSDNVKLGEISSIQENASVILRVETEKVDERMLYWRGIVMDYFDGTSWKALNPTRSPKARFAVSGKKVTQTIYLEPYENKYLFALDTPVSVNYKDVIISGDRTIQARQDIDRRIKYVADSVLTGTLSQEGIDRGKYLQLPARDFGKIEELVKKLSPGRNKEENAIAILRYLRSGEFRYSLKNLPVSLSPLEDFLFRYKYGNCEYFASTMAVMLRISGIPARIVGGYRGGHYNNLGGYYLVSQNEAHVWVEAYFDGKGWVRMDPTPGGIVGQEGFFSKLGLFLDSINYYWNAMIIGYDLNKQISLLTNFRNIIRRPRIEISFLKNYAAEAGLILLGVVSATVLVYGFARRKPPEKQIIDKFVQKMKKYGFERSSSEGLSEFAGRIEDPLLKQKVLEFITEFEQLFYRDRKMTRSDQARLKKLLHHL